MFANVALEEENVIFSLGRFSMNWRIGCLFWTQRVSKFILMKSVYSKQFQVTNSKYKQHVKYIVMTVIELLLSGLMIQNVQYHSV